VQGEGEALEPGRLPVAGAVGDENAEIALEVRRLAVEGIDAVAPAGVKEDEREALADPSVVQADGRDSGREGRRGELEERQCAASVRPQGGHRVCMAS
jgi:hypothetical protein